MIRLCEAPDEAFFGFCSACGAFGCRVASTARSYPGLPFVRCWVQEEGGAACAAVSLLDGAATVCCGKLTDRQRQELAAFLGALDADSVLSPGGALPADPASSSGAVLRWGPTASAAGAGELESAPEARALAELFLTCSGHGIRWRGTDAEYADLSHRLRHGRIRAVAKRAPDGRLCAAVLTTAETAEAAVIGGVCARPEVRGKGLASSLVSVLCASLAREGKNVFLLAEDGLLPFYRRLGFEACGRWQQSGARGKEHSFGDVV